MHVALDVHYRQAIAVGAAVAFADYASDQVEREWTRTATSPAPYRPGEFYRRELPMLLELLSD